MTRLVSALDIMGEMASWAVQQHPYHAPDGLFEVCALIQRRALEQFEDNIAELPMRRFEDAQAIYDWLKSILIDHPVLMAWNTPKSGHGQHVVVSRYSRPDPANDFIDLSALLGNVAMSAWRNAEDFNIPAPEFTAGDWQALPIGCKP